MASLLVFLCTHDRRLTLRVLALGVVNLPVLITTPHSSGFAPFDVLAEMLGPQVHERAARETRLRHLFGQGDPFTDAIFYAPGATHLFALASRFVVDVNRHRDQGGENGVIKLSDFQGVSLYPEGFTLDARAKERRLKRYWDGYHRQIAEALQRGGVAFFIDGHAMSPIGPKIGPDEGKPRPALSLVTGGDREGEPLEPSRPTSIPGELARLVATKLLEHFAPLLETSKDVPPIVTINDPFAGGGIQQRYSDPALSYRKPGFAIEVNRALYLETGPDGFDWPIPGRVEALNRAFNAFLRDLLPALMQRSLTHRAGERAFICNG